MIKAGAELSQAQPQLELVRLLSTAYILKFASIKLNVSIISFYFM